MARLMRSTRARLGRHPSLPRTPPGSDRREVRGRGRAGAVTCGAGLIASLALGACTAGPSPEPVGPDAVAAIQTGVDEFLNLADPYSQVRAVLVYRDGEPVLESYRAGADEGDSWDIRSVTKSVMSALIGIAIDDGSIDGVDATLGELLPSYSDAIHPRRRLPPGVLRVRLRLAD